MWIFFFPSSVPQIHLSPSQRTLSLCLMSPKHSPPLLAHFITFLGRVLSVIVLFEGG